MSIINKTSNLYEHLEESLEIEFKNTNHVNVTCDKNILEYNMKELTEFLIDEREKMTIKKIEINIVNCNYGSECDMVNMTIKTQINKTNTVDILNFTSFPVHDLCGISNMLSYINFYKLTNKQLIKDHTITTQYKKSKIENTKITLKHKTVIINKHTLKHKADLLKIFCEKLTTKDDVSYLRLLLMPYDLDEDVYHKHIDYGKMLYMQYKKKKYNKKMSFQETCLVILKKYAKNQVFILDQNFTHSLIRALKYQQP